MSDPLDHRVTKLEFRVDGHDKEIATVHSRADAMNKTLTAIEANLKQIKWIATGAAAAFAVQYFGIEKAIKLLF